MDRGSCKHTAIILQFIRLILNCLDVVAVYLLRSIHKENSIIR